MDETKLSPPWGIYYKRVLAIFGRDDDVRIEYKENFGVNPELTLHVDGTAKAKAIGELLPTEKQFGNVTLKIVVAPANSGGITATLKDAFIGNPAVVEVLSSREDPRPRKNFVVFDANVAQYFSDNLDDAHGLTSELYQDIAKEIFNEFPDVSYCTTPETIIDVV